MIFIDLVHKLPTDPDLPEAVRWSQKAWEAWLTKSKHLVEELSVLNSEGKIEERNKLIDKNSAHWGALKPWLLELSNGKCWFSEVRDLYSHYDVEHFRPKKEAKELVANIRDGYWWLAFDYMNFRVCGNVGNRKKGGWFPLREGSLCSTYEHRCEDAETVYLLDPVDESDVQLITFDEEGKVIPAPDVSQWEEERVMETIKRLKLNDHAPLAEERRKIWQKMNGLIEEYTNAKAGCAAGMNPVAKEKLRQSLFKMRLMVVKQAELSSVARWCILFRNDSGLNRFFSAV